MFPPLPATRATRIESHEAPPLRAPAPINRLSTIVLNSISKVMATKITIPRVWKPVTTPYPRATSHITMTPGKIGMINPNRPTSKKIWARITMMISSHCGTQHLLFECPIAFTYRVGSPRCRPSRAAAHPAPPPSRLPAGSFPAWRSGCAAYPAPSRSRYGPIASCRHLPGGT